MLLLLRVRLVPNPDMSLAAALPVLIAGSVVQNRIVGSEDLHHRLQAWVDMVQVLLVAVHRRPPHLPLPR